MSDNVILELKQLQADAHGLFVKIHNYHWNVKGLDFHPVHLKTEEMYNSMAVLYDDTAERIIQLGGTPHLKIIELFNAMKIKEEVNSTFTSKEVISNIIEDFEYLLNHFKTLSKISEEDNDRTTISFADNNIATYEKELWMLKAMIK